MGELVCPANSDIAETLLRSASNSTGLQRHGSESARQATHMKRPLARK
jgi:hypothetical protein